DVDRLLDDRMRHSRRVNNLYIVDAIDRRPGLAQLADRVDFLVGDDEPGGQRRPPWFQEPDRCGLVPDRVSWAQDLDQHDHVHRIHGAVEAPAVDRADVVARAPGERDPDAHLAKVRGDVRDSPSGAAVGREEIELPAHQTGGKRLRHGGRLSEPGVQTAGRVILPLVIEAPGYRVLLASGELEDRVERLYALLRACTVCPRDCGNDRLAGVLASCATGDDPIVSSYTPHVGEH